MIPQPLENRAEVLTYAFDFPDFRINRILIWPSLGVVSPTVITILRSIQLPGDRTPGKGPKNKHPKTPFPRDGLGPLEL